MRKLFSVLLLSLISTTIVAAELEIIHLNIGQGDATLILGPTTDARKAVLMDAGNIKGPDAGKVIADYLAARNITSLTAFIASHYDADHIGGLVTKKPTDARNAWGQRIQDGPDGIANNADDIAIKLVVDRGDANTPAEEDRSETLRRYFEFTAVHPNHISIDTNTELKNFAIDLGDGAQFKVIAANGFVLDQGLVTEVDTENEHSLVFLLSYNKFHYLIGGDATGQASGAENAEVEQAIAAYLSDNGVNLDVIQVNHHGANNGSAADFLAVVKPEVAIISAGNGNSHEHPDFRALSRLAAADVKWIYSTNFGTTVWDDEVLDMKKNQLSQAQKDHLATILQIRKKLIVAQNHILLSSNGEGYRITVPFRDFSTDD